MNICHEVFIKPIGGTYEEIQSYFVDRKNSAKLIELLTRYRLANWDGSISCDSAAENWILKLTRITKI